MKIVPGSASRDTLKTEDSSTNAVNRWWQICCFPSQCRSVLSKCDRYGVVSSEAHTGSEASSPTSLQLCDCLPSKQGRSRTYACLSNYSGQQIYEKHSRIHARKKYTRAASPAVDTHSRARFFPSSVRKGMLARVLGAAPVQDERMIITMKEMMTIVSITTVRVAEHIRLLDLSRMPLKILRSGINY